LFVVVNFLKRVVTHRSRLVFQLLLLRHRHFTRQYSYTLEVWWDL